MKLYRAADMREADRLAEAAGVSTWQLMEAAGKAVAQEVVRRYPARRTALVLCGKGNNGGDGYVCARDLAALGLTVRVLELSPEPGRPDARRAREALLAGGVTPEPLTSWESVAPGPSAVIVDAILGSGLSRPVEGWLGELLVRLSGFGAPVVAIDVPSGLPTDAPQLMGPHVTADVTVELAGHKLAGAFFPTRRAYGERVLAPIGVPPAVLDACGHVLLLDAATVFPWLPERPRDAHKYTAGTVTVVAGSKRYAGAGELACRGAWRAGAGLVTLLGTARHPAAWPETIFEELPLPEGGPAGLDAPADSGAPAQTTDLAELTAEVRHAFVPRRAAATLIGPGLAEGALGLLPTLLRLAPGPVVLDATALSPAAWPATARAELGARGGVVMTPHAGEAAALLGAEPPEVVQDPLDAAAMLATGFGATVVLKGATTVISSPDGRVAVSERGHPGMAAGGTGDVLAGVIAALLAPAGGQERLFERACAAVWLHGVAGELAAERSGLGLVASDLADALPAAAALAKA